MREPASEPGMRGERRLLRLGEYLVRLACRRLPPGTREERYREWAAELPAILHDPQTRPALRRAVRMLGYAADMFRGTSTTPDRAWHRRHREAAALSLLLLAGLAGLAVGIWTTVRTPGNGLNYLQLAWALLNCAIPISIFVRSSTRRLVLIAGSGLVVGLIINLWDTAQSPADWVNYVVSAVILFILLASWLALVRLRRRFAG
jgi:hypothetical protein